MKIITHYRTPVQLGPENWEVQTAMKEFNEANTIQDVADWLTKEKFVRNLKDWELTLTFLEI